MGRPDGPRTLERSRHRWEDGIEMVFKEVCCDAGVWIDLAQHNDQWRAYIRMVMNLEVP